MDLSRLFGPSKPPRRGDRGEVLPEQHEGNPDSYRPSGLCPRCGKQCSFEVLGSLAVTFDRGVVWHLGSRQEPDVLDRVSALVCRHCAQGVAVVEEQWVGETAWRKRDRSTGGAITYRGLHWWPLPEAQVSDDVPQPIADAFAEAVTALAAHCPRAAAVMARRTLEAIAGDKGENSGVLADRLNALAKKGVLQPDLAEWAKEVRLVGNSGAHFDLMQAVSEDDARQLLAFIRELLRYLYELPAELARRRRPTP